MQAKHSTEQVHQSLPRRVRRGGVCEPAKVSLAAQTRIEPYGTDLKSPGVVEQRCVVVVLFRGPFTVASHQKRAGMKVYDGCSHHRPEQDASVHFGILAVAEDVVRHPDL